MKKLTERIDPVLTAMKTASRAVFASGATRLLAVDGLRGLIIVVMALDHANHFVAQKHSSGEYWGGPFPAYESALPFVTRLVTHLAAPGFFFLMGVGMLMFARTRLQKGWSRWALLRHFWLRGVLLILIQLFIVNRAWEFSPGGWGVDLYIGVLFALGGAMIIGSLLLWLKPIYLVIVIAALFIGTELIHPDPALWGLVRNDVPNLLLVRPGGDVRLWSNYPILPWLELVIFGLLFGHWLAANPDKAYRRGLLLGTAFLTAFVILRWLDGFGNIRPREGSGWIDYLNVVKYPPSLTFTLLTMGFNLVILWLFSRLARFKAIILQPLAVFGRAPLFFYVLHLFLYAGHGALFTPRGTTIAAMYPHWLLVLIALFPACLWFARFKQSRPVNSPVRLF